MQKSYSHTHLRSYLMYPLDTGRSTSSSGSPSPYPLLCRPYFFLQKNELDEEMTAGAVVLRGAPRDLGESPRCDPDVM